jgi:acyl-CoA synthetase (AMP-forming)/AMP-acid ligase II
MNASLDFVISDRKSIYDLINEHARFSPDKLFLSDPISGVSLTYSELCRRVKSVAACIDSKGIKPGEAVAYAMSNSVDTATAILGILYGGYLATAINLVAGNSVIEYVLEHSEAKLVFTNDAGQRAIQEPLSKLSNITTVSVSSVLSDQSGEALEHLSGGEDGGLLMYTSGTTGRPKGVVLSQGNLLAGGANTAIAHKLTATDCGMCVLPLYHINGLCVTVMGALVSGGTLIIPPKFSVTTFWENIISENCTWFSVVPTQISYLLHDKSSVPDHDQLANVRFGRSASAPLSPDVQTSFENTFNIPIIETMGLTETAAQILSNPLPPGTRKIGSPGIPFGNEVAIADPQQNELPYGIEGEVLVRGPNVMQFYLKNEAATSEAITSAGWLRTGDLGRMDEDGYVFITGRLKELIIKGGENIAPREIDEALYTHPDVVEAAAFAKKCDNYGERVEAAVMVSQGSKLLEENLISLCREKLGAYKCPDRIHFLPELPKGPSGKIQRIKLAELYR